MNLFQTNWLTAILNGIDTNEMPLFLSIGCVACEAPIATNVMMQFGLEYYHAWASCTMLSFAIIFFTIKKSWIALIFAIIELVFCGYFFCNHLGWSLLLIPASGFSFAMPFSVYAYSQVVKIEKPVIVEPVIIPEIKAKTKSEIYKEQQENLENLAKEQLL